MKQPACKVHAGPGLFRFLVLRAYGAGVEVGTGVGVWPI